MQFITSFRNTKPRFTFQIEKTPLVQNEKPPRSNTRVSSGRDRAKLHSEHADGDNVSNSVN